MPHDVFVSHSTKDKLAADAVVAHLERDGVRCWCAPRDIVPGTSWATSIMNAITSCKAMVVVFSHNANESDHIRREVERAISHGIAVVPVRIEDVKPEGDLEYFLSSAHWMDAITGSLERDLDDLALRIKSLLITPGEKPAVAVVDGTDQPPQQRRKRYWLAAGVVLIALLGLLALAFQKTPLFASSAATQTSFSFGVLKPTFPADGEIVVGPLLQYVWTNGTPVGMNTWCEVERSTDAAPSVVNRVVGRSFTETSLSGNIRWRIRTGHTVKGVDQFSPWTDWQTTVYYRDALEKVVATRSICIAFTDENETFVRVEDGVAHGYEIELLKRIFTAHLRKLGINEPFTINYQFVPWGEKLFSSLETSTIDLVGSGISITAEREKNYHVTFTAPIAEFPPAMVFLKGGAFDPKTLTNARLGAAERTTDFALAQKIASAIPGVTATSFAGDDTNQQLVSSMLKGTIDAAIVDSPYAFAMVERYGRQNIQLKSVPVDAAVFPDAPLEHIGFMTRPSDSALRDVINAATHDDRAMMEDVIRHEHIMGVNLPSIAK